ncbi:hypothetical protein SK128_006565 [Halocaridina rubra]|uniref:Uncharacterized protein n=1 Tax=Halocaridina rubra TaxID=373956 RepID=A0AAN8WVN2_HALRR
MRGLILLLILQALFTVLVESSSCARDKFKCRGDKCIYESWVCDGRQDCLHADDEQHCGRCPIHHFECSSGTCIENSKICDEKPDCDDGSDESSCGTECYSVEFTCSNGECISGHALRCDGKQDCSDGSDEHDCESNPSCSQDQFTCFNGTCIKSSWVCDGDADCSSGEDEKNCEKFATCPSDQITCPNGGCASNYFLCLLDIIENTTPHPDVKPLSISSNTTNVKNQGSRCSLGEGCLGKVMAVVFGTLAILTLAFIGSFCLRYRRKARSGLSPYFPLSRQQETISHDESITMSNVL